MRKSFTDNLNPVMQFISSASERAAAETTAETTPADPPRDSSANPAYKANPAYIEKRTRRIQVIVQPSVYERIKAAAERGGQSVNDYIHNTLDQATQPTQERED